MAKQTDNEITEVIATLLKAKETHAKLLKEFIEGGIFDHLAGPILKETIQKFEGFINEGQYATSKTQLNEIFLKHFKK